MGRVSLPYLNKVGYSMFWDSMWDDKHNYTKLLVENLYIYNCIPLIFDDLPDKSLISFLKTKDDIVYYINNYKIPLKFNITNFKDLYKFYKKKYYFNVLSKIWILRYQSWLIIYFYIYYSNLNINFSKTNFFSIYKNLSYHNIYYNYYIYQIKLNYNHILYKNIIINKYNF